MYIQFNIFNFKSNKYNKIYQYMFNLMYSKSLPI